ncbi:MAG: hypothetical protein FWH33_07850, partial [Oscillospiraceae bacterium]|nr:hypothetical protein [Oscillospiraceae bacterium]
TLSNIRNGIEGVNSVLRRKFAVDRMRDKGLVRKRQRWGLKMMAINAERLRKWRKDGERTAEKLLLSFRTSFFAIRFFHCAFSSTHDCSFLAV